MSELPPKTELVELDADAEVQKSLLEIEKLFKEDKFLEVSEKLKTLKQILESKNSKLTETKIENKKEGRDPSFVKEVLDDLVKTPGVPVPVSWGLDYSINKDKSIVLIGLSSDKIARIKSEYFDEDISSSFLFPDLSKEWSNKRGLHILSDDLLGKKVLSIRTKVQEEVMGGIMDDYHWELKVVK